MSGFKKCDTKRRTANHHLTKKKTYNKKKYSKTIAVI